MPSLVRILCLGLLMTCPLPALALEDTPQNREQEANRYLQVFPPEQMAYNLAQRMASNLPQAQQQQFLTAMGKYLNRPAITAAAHNALVKWLTADELHVLADFYSSPVAKSAMGKMGTLMSEVMPAVMQEVQAAAAKAQQETGVQLSQPR